MTRTLTAAAAAAEAGREYSSVEFFSVGSRAGEPDGYTCSEGRVYQYVPARQGDCGPVGTVRQDVTDQAMSALRRERREHRIAVLAKGRDVHVPVPDALGPSTAYVVGRQHRWPLDTIRAGEYGLRDIWQLARAGYRLVGPGAELHRLATSLPVSLASPSGPSLGPAIS